MTPPDDFAALADVVDALRGIDERLREEAYERLRAGVDGDEAAVAAERRVQQARRAVNRAIQALGGELDDG